MHRGGEIKSISSGAQRVTKRILLSVWLLLAGCDDNQSAHERSIIDNAAKPIEMTFFSPVSNLTAGSPVPFAESCMSQIGVCFYKIQRSANDKDLPTLNVVVNDRSLRLEQAINITVMADKGTSSNIEMASVILRGLPKGSTHEQYRQLIFNLITNIKDAGWSHFFMPEDPRVSGSQIQKVESPGKILGESVRSHPWLDPDYQLDINRWLKIGPFYNWYFYNGGSYLHLKAWRQDDDENPEQKATYLISLEFQSERQFWLSGVSDENDRAHWKQLLPNDWSTITR